MKSKNNNGLKKSILVGTLALALSIPVGAGAASASVPSANSYWTISPFTSHFGIDLNALFQQYNHYPIAMKPTASTQPSKPVTQPSKPATQPSKPVTQPSKPVTQPVAAVSSYATQVVTLVNQERAKAGLPALKMSNATLTTMALDKAKDIYNNNYFDHNSPTYGSPFDMMKKYGISYRYAGENIAKGQRSPQEVMTAWMNSSGHRANILSTNFTTIGAAYYNGVWVQEFIA